MAKYQENTLDNMKKSEQLLGNIESALQHYDEEEEEETSQATGEAALGKQVISALDIFGQPTHKQVGMGKAKQADLLAQTANAVKNAKLALQENLQGGQKNNEVQGVDAGYIDQETTKLDDIVGELSKLSTEKKVNGELSTESKEKVKELTEQIAEEKKAISNKVAVAQVNGQISGKTLDNMKKSEQLLGNIESVLQNYDEEEETSQATRQAGLGRQVISALDIFGQPTHKQVEEQADILAQTANAVKNAKLALQQNLQGGQKNNEVQGIAAGYIDQETTKLDDIVGELAKLSTEKEVNGKLSTESKEKVKEITEQIAEEKEAISNKLAVAQVNGQISGNTLDNMKKSEQLLGNIESALQHYDEEEEEETSQATGQAALGKQVISALDIFGQPTHKQVGMGKAKQADLLAQTANAVKNAKLALQENLQGGQ